MTPEQQAIGVLWIFISGGMGAIVKYLVNELNRRDAVCNDRITQLEARLDAGAETMRRLNEVLQKQVDAHEMTIERLTRSEAK